MVFRNVFLSFSDLSLTELNNIQGFQPSPKGSAAARIQTARSHHVLYHFAFLPIFKNETNSNEIGR